MQECREACGGQGLKTENRVGVHKGEYDVQSTFEGDNNILMQQVIWSAFVSSELRLSSCSEAETVLESRSGQQGPPWRVHRGSEEEEAVQGARIGAHERSFSGDPSESDEFCRQEHPIPGY